MAEIVNSKIVHLALAARSTGFLRPLPTKKLMQVKLRLPREDYKNTLFCHLTPDTAFEKYTVVFFFNVKKGRRKKGRDGLKLSRRHIRRF